MDREQLTQRISDLLEETGEAHRLALAATAGRDPEWALWYAERLFQPLGELLDREATRSGIIKLLIELEDEYAALDPGIPWHEFSARTIVDRCLPAPDERLALYHFEGCPYCRMVRRVIDELDTEVELRDIWRDQTARQELLEARGRTTVPVLRCSTPETDRWLPESRDIMTYLRKRFGPEC